MSESSNLKDKSQSFIPINYSSAIETEQLSVHSARNLLLSVETNNSKSTENSSQKNVTYDVVNTNKTVSDCESFAKKRVQPEYPLTKWSKREIAAKNQTERDKKYENIKRINEKIKRGAEAIKVHNVISELYCV